MKHIGIVACSAEGAALCYRIICQEGSEVLGDYNHPEITMHTPPLSEYMKFLDKDDWVGVGNLIIESVKILFKAGADFAICPDNTIHTAYAQMIDRSPLPWLHIVEEVGREAKKRNYTKLGILGTKFTMTGTVYTDILTKMGIGYEIPDKEAIDKIDQIIFEELVHGKILAKSQTYFLSVIQELKANGCDAVILGCTEIPLIVNQETSPLPTLDSTMILAKAALNFAIS